MNITLPELLAMIGEREVLIAELRKRVAALEAALNEQAKG